MGGHQEEGPGVGQLVVQEVARPGVLEGGLLQPGDALEVLSPGRADDEGGGLAGQHVTSPARPARRGWEPGAAPG